MILPAHANLEHLRNEAKALLKKMRIAHPDSTLAAAQLAVARSYGFRSWRKLKSYVDALRDFGAPLVSAVRSGDLAAMRAILDRHPELANAAADLQEQRIRPSDAPAMRLVHLAIAENRMEALRLLIERGASVNIRNASGRLPLHDCFELDSDGFVPLLLTAGAEPDVCAAAVYGMRDKLVELLERDPSQANDLRTGMSPVGWCSYGRQPECARLLIEHGAVVNRPPYDVEAWGPAAHVASILLARVLLEHGADPNCRDEDGDTPIQAAIKSRLVADPADFVELLLTAGADPSIRNNDGRTALDEARLQADKSAETYYPARPAGLKRMDRVIALLMR
jgi:ankyrin repeat protein